MHMLYQMGHMVYSCSSPLTALLNLTFLTHYFRSLTWQCGGATGGVLLCVFELVSTNMLPMYNTCIYNPLSPTHPFSFFIFLQVNAIISPLWYSGFVSLPRAPLFKVLLLLCRRLLYPELWYFIRRLLVLRFISVPLLLLLSLLGLGCILLVTFVVALSSKLIC